MSMSGYPPRIFLVRHGQTFYNLERRIQGQNDIPLNSKGREQARRAGELLANLMSRQPEYTLKYAYSSSLVRAVETAQIIAEVIKARCAQEITFSLDARLQEAHMGGLQHKTIAEFEQEFPSLWKDYCLCYEKDPWYTRYPLGGESRFCIAKRVVSFLQSVPLQNSEYAIFCTHGGTIDVLLEVLGCKDASTVKFTGNGDILLLERTDSSVEDSWIFQTFHYNERWRILAHYEVDDVKFKIR